MQGNLPSTAADYPAAAFESWERFERANRFWFRARERLIGWALEKYFPEARSVLEVGCGTGSVLRYLRESRPELELTGVDSSERAIELAGERVEGCGSRPATCATSRSTEYDVAGAFDVIEHLDDDAGALAALREAVRPGGGVIVTVPQHPRLWSAFDEYAGHKRRYRRRELIERIEGAGLEIELVTSFVSLPLPALALSRLFERGGEDYDPIAEAKAPPLAGTLDRVLSAEAWMIRHGWTWRGGGSLLAVARRPGG